MKHSIMFKSNKFSNNNGLYSTPIYSKMAVVLISRQVSPIVQIVRTVRATAVTFSSEIGRFHKGRLHAKSIAYGKQHETIIDSALRTDKKATQSHTSLTTKSYAHEVDPTVTETAILSETTLAKGGNGIQFYTWKDNNKTRVTHYQVKNNFTSRRETTSEEDKNFQEGKKMQNNPSYRDKNLTPERRFCSPAEHTRPTTLAEKEIKKFTKKTKNETENKPNEID